MDALDAFADSCRRGETALGDATAGGRVAFLAVCVDDTPPRGDAALRRWPHLAHYWVEAAAVASARVAFVPNRALISPRGVVHRWWDGTGGNVLRGPHGASRNNGSHGLLREIALAL
mmetsp:Transcript_565/g.2004  ORF Transcript_565/g.2004 Transcript_565/m.2004 type:complete len:117 (-) Transcript_565:186-536(-)